SNLIAKHNRPTIKKRCHYVGWLRHITLCEVDLIFVNVAFKAWWKSDCRPDVFELFFVKVSLGRATEHDLLEEEDGLAWGHIIAKCPFVRVVVIAEFLLLSV